MEQGMRLMATLEIIIRNARAQMMNMVETDVAGKPLQNLRQLVERATLQSGSREIPLVTALPVNPLELMLHVKQPPA